MSEEEKVEAQAAVDELDEDHPDYKPPAPKSLNEILDQDKEDESLRKYKEQLLGTSGGTNVIVDPNNPHTVIVKKLAICPEGHANIEIDLTLPEDEIKKTKVVLKEGVKYHVEVFFHVQREIVTGLRYCQSVTRMGVKVDHCNTMLGSYGPKSELYKHVGAEDEAPSGLTGRGDYKIKSSFTDDDKNVYHKWEWHLSIKKDFE